ncbi:hypothetical protein K7X08_032499 [Anisodus acutangulus]|uniref:Uncharacterized protein n=1 Tax=Anisodus acutangulus TaxID=402998 RepID=A0A9Q1LML0_9SOLA|nr:hypothetical protein K7X08_032499 [Anisodus acutangulus]
MPILAAGIIARAHTRELSLEPEEVTKKEPVQAKKFGPAQAPEGFIATLVLKDTMTHILRVFEGWPQAGAPSFAPHGSHTRVGDQTRNQGTAGYRTPKAHPATIVALQFLGYPQGVDTHPIIHPTMIVD